MEEQILLADVHVLENVFFCLIWTFCEAKNAYKENWILHFLFFEFIIEKTWRQTTPFLGAHTLVKDIPMDYNPTTQTKIHLKPFMEAIHHLCRSYIYQLQKYVTSLHGATLWPNFSSRIWTTGYRQYSFDLRFKAHRMNNRKGCNIK